MGEERSELAGCLGQTVVVDTQTPFLYLGVLREIGKDFLVLEDVDVHDTSEGGSTKEIYVLEARKFGVRVNRKKAQVRQSVVVSVSLLEDVVVY
jgi:hypothetical protein